MTDHAETSVASSPEVQSQIRARIISRGLGTLFGAVTDIGSRIAQTVGLSIGAELSVSDRDAISQYLQTRSGVVAALGTDQPPPSASSKPPNLVDGTLQQIRPPEGKHQKEA